MSEQLNYTLAIVKQLNRNTGNENMVTLNVGTDRNNGEPTNLFKTEQQIFAWAAKHGLEIHASQLCESPAIGDWEAENVWSVKVEHLIPRGGIAELCEITGQDAIACYDHSRKAGFIVWNESLPEDTERFEFNAEYFHFVD